ncbi:ABC transporter ATP-binding protein [Halocatena marina]|uniref:Nickel import system ATP-binding protein NikD n=1 Tax=Halocatena marina TaxID=2934937 RepID=A0ABD5YZH9_9EURY|nr:ABC transporter ATP-binding protein [Halocatena marina]
MTAVSEKSDHSGEDNTGTIIEVEDASVKFPSSTGELKVLNNVTLDINRGEVLGIVGESGSGKSMFGSSLLDAVEEPGHTTGSVTYHPTNGEPVSILDLSEDQLRELRWEEIAMVFQGAMDSFNPTMRIREHFEETLEAHDRDLKEGMQRSRQLISDLYLEPDRVLDAYPHELSGGMSQRALIALSLLLEPDVLVMDEPTAALDLLMQQSIIALLNEIGQKYDLTMVFITHDLPLVAKLADRLAVVYAFELVEVGPTSRLLQSASHPYTRSLLRATPNTHAPLEEMRPIEGSAPNPANVPIGCSYNDRCPIASNHCTEEDPVLESITDNHRVACFYPEEARKSVQFSLEKGEEVNQ